MRSPHNPFRSVYGIPASEASGGTSDSSDGVSDYDRKYYSLERAREVLDDGPQYDAAESRQ